MKLRRRCVFDGLAASRAMMSMPSLSAKKSRRSVRTTGQGEKGISETDADHFVVWLKALFTRKGMA